MAPPNAPPVRPSSRRRGAVRWLALALLVGAVVGAAPTTLRAQQADTTRASTYGTGAGLQILLSNNGFGLGVYYTRALRPTTSLLLEASLGAGKDEREVKFFSYFGRSIIPNKANYLLMLPVQVGVVQRLFSETIEENFRPYLQLSVGPTLGWEYPYFRDCNGNGTLEANDANACGDGSFERTYDALGALPKGHVRLGVGGTFALGAHFGLSRKVTQGVRVGYAATYFFEEIALLEPGIEGGQQHYFGSPTISLTFGRLF